MNIPIEIARAQGHHGIRGGRPRLDLTPDQRKERRRLQFEACRRRKGILPRRPAMTFEQRVERSAAADCARWDAEYFRVWRKQPGEQMTSDEFLSRQDVFRRWVRDCRARANAMSWPVRFVREQLRGSRRRRVETWQPRVEPERVKVSPHIVNTFAYSEAYCAIFGEDELEDLGEWYDEPVIHEACSATARVLLLPGRNEPCHCGSGRKFKKCCG